MNMKKIFSMLLLMLMAFSFNVLTAQEMPPIPVDDAVRIGKLDCGLTYYIRHNDYPEHRVNFYIAQRVGSIQEEESQRGLAHFLEHMAFNGSEHFNGEGKGIIDYTRSLGVNFGGDLNAYTSIAETVYNINDVPSTRQSAIDSCLLILKDWSNGLLLTDEEIDKERGVIHEEWRLGQSAQMRILERQLETLFPDSKFGKRLPIGLMSVVDNFPYKDLRDYYHKWYRPDNQALVIVGDVDVDHIEAKIKEMYNGYTLDPNAAQVVRESVPDNDTPIIVVDKDKEQQYSEVSVMFKHETETPEEKKDLMYLMVDYMKDMIVDMLNQRLNDMAQEPDCPFNRAYCYDAEYILANTMDAFTIDVMPKEGKTEAATQAVIIEALRAAKHGFTASEYQRASDEYMSRLEKRYNERDKISNESYGRQYCSNYLDGEPIPSVEQRYQLMGMIAPQITVDFINQVMPELISTDGKNLVIMNTNQEKEGAVYPTVEALQAAYEAATAADIQPYVDNVKNEPLMTKLPKKGKIKKESYNSQWDYKELELSNGARVILKKTDFKQDEIRMSAFQRGGQSLYGENDWANLNMISALSNITGVGNFSNSELQKALAGKQVGVYLNVGEYTDQLSGNSTVKDLETMFQLIYLNFTALNKDEKKFNQTMSLMETQLKNKDLMPETAMSDSLQYIMSNYSWRGKPFNVEDLKQVSLDRILEIAKERTANAANYTFTFIGAIDEATIRPLIEQYIASLPAKKGKKTNWVNFMEMPKGEVLCHFNKKMESPKEYEIVIWHNNDLPHTLENEVKAEMLAQCLSRVYLQKIREDAGAAYSTDAVGQTGMAGDRPMTMVLAVCPVNPEYEEMALNIINEEMKNACTTIDATALTEAAEQMLKDYTTNSKENWFWLSAIQQYLIHGYDGVTSYEQIVKAQTPESIAEFARQLFGAGNKIELVMGPEK
ncbi:MAG: insulinase family protein [Muribaculaceae bacterium]|nr:insulinase family protein [Muribaculaceae bacterium]